MDHPVMTCPLETPPEELTEYVKDFNRTPLNTRPIKEQLSVVQRYYDLLRYQHESVGADLWAEIRRLRDLLADADTSAGRFLQEVKTLVASRRLTEGEAAQAFLEPPGVLFDGQQPLLLPDQVINAAAKILRTLAERGKRKVKAKPKRRPLAMLIAGSASVPSQPRRRSPARVRTGERTGKSKTAPDKKLRSSQ